MRVKNLMLMVKHCTKSYGVLDKAVLTSYKWMILVIYYLQQIDFVPKLIQNIRGVETKEMFQYTKSWKRPKRLEQIMLLRLFYGFLRFYSFVFPYTTTAISISTGTRSIAKSFVKGANFWRICVLDPLPTNEVDIDLCLHLSVKRQEQLFDFFRKSIKQVHQNQISNSQI